MTFKIPFLQFSLLRYISSQFTLTLPSLILLIKNFYDGPKLNMCHATYLFQKPGVSWTVFSLKTEVKLLAI